MNVIVNKHFERQQADKSSGDRLITVLSATMDDREAKLGFKPQKEVPYNALLPYADSLDAESNDQLAHIKANMARVVQLRDIKIGGSHWSGQLSKLVLFRIFGMEKYRPYPGIAPGG